MSFNYTLLLKEVIIHIVIKCFMLAVGSFNWRAYALLDPAVGVVTVRSTSKNYACFAYTNGQQTSNNILIVKL